MMDETATDVGVGIAPMPAADPTTGFIHFEIVVGR